MKKKILLLYLILVTFSLVSCQTKHNEMTRIVFLHHSTGQSIWYGNVNRYIRKLTDRSDVRSYFKEYNRKNNTNYFITKQWFPGGAAYKGTNNPYDYYNIWVKNQGDEPFLGNPTLEILTKEFDIIVFKHCYPVSSILEDIGQPDLDSDEKRIENYKLHYEALKSKMHEFPENKFIVWTPAVHVGNNITPEQAQRTNDFYQWVINEWDEKGDNIYIWDFYKYETNGGLYMRQEYASGANDSHPNKQFAGEVAPKFAKFIIDVAQGIIE